MDRFDGPPTEVPTRPRYKTRFFGAEQSPNVDPSIGYPHGPAVASRPDAMKGRLHLVWQACAAFLTRQMPSRVEL
jgi:hypothetical protein